MRQLQVFGIIFTEGGTKSMQLHDYITRNQEIIKKFCSLAFSFGFHVLGVSLMVIKQKLFD